MTALRQNFIQQMELKGRSPKTINTYVHVISKLSRFYNLSPLKISTQQIRDYLHYQIKNKLLCEKTINQHIGALKTFYKHMLPESDIMNGITSMKEPSVLPVVLSKTEIARLLEAPNNIKHRAILEVLYSSGIRLQECCDLELCDIIRERNLLHIKSGKGKKERYTILSNKALKTLTFYYYSCRPQKYLFEGFYGKQYSKRSVEKLVSAAAQKAGIKKNVSPHILRHSFATHLHENGVSLQIIQKLLGHTDIKTTTIYSHISTQSISAVVNPLDCIISGKEQL